MDDLDEIIDVKPFTHFFYYNNYFTAKDIIIKALKRDWLLLASYIQFCARTE